MTAANGPLVISLVPSITETLLDWGIEPAGVTRFCEAPGIRTVGGTKNPDIEAIVGLAPDLVVMDREENRATDAEQLSAAGVRVLATHVTSVGDVTAALESLRAALGVDLPVDKTGLPSEEDGPEASLGARGERDGRRVRVWVPIWRRPWMTIGGATYGSSLLTLAGFQNVFEGSEPYPLSDPDEAARLQPDFVLAPSEPYKFAERHLVELETAAPAVFVDGQDLFGWGARTPAALGRLGNLAAELRARQDSARPD